MTAPARADDFGAHADLRAIRGSAPILLGHYLAAPLDVNDVVVDENAAVATWHSAGRAGIATFVRRSDRWWLVATFDTSGPAVGRTVAELQSDLAISPALAQRVEQHVAGVDALQPIKRQVYQAACAACLPTLWNFADGFEATLTFVAATPTWDPGFALRGRAASVAEMPPAPSMNSYYFFRLVTKGATIVSIRQAKLDVWFPYVLDASKGYVLWLDFLTPDLDGIPGTLHGNTLHFTLPAFATIPGKEAFGEIDGA